MDSNPGLSGSSAYSNSLTGRGISHPFLNNTLTGKARPPPPCEDQGWLLCILSGLGSANRGEEKLNTISTQPLPVSWGQGELITSQEQTPLYSCSSLHETYPFPQSRPRPPHVRWRGPPKGGPLTRPQTSAPPDSLHLNGSSLLQQKLLPSRKSTVNTA